MAAELVEYVVPVTIDHAGKYPGRKSGDVWFTEMNGRRFRQELIGAPYGRNRKYDPPGGGPIFIDCHVQEVPL